MSIIRNTLISVISLLIGGMLATEYHRWRQPLSSPLVTPAGSPKTVSVSLLDLGAKLLQRHDPLKGYNIYLVAFHPMRDDPNHQMQAFHYCKQVNEDFAQCMLFDSNAKDANLNGVEYIISDKLYRQLPAGEKQYWHPHNYEILSGQLVAPGLPDAAEKRLLHQKMNSYGKTWHVWMTGRPGAPGDALPLGDAKLAWSFNHDGELRDDLLSYRDQQFHINSQQKRSDRQDLAADAKPQLGTDVLKGQFTNAQSPVDIQAQPVHAPVIEYP